MSDQSKRQVTDLTRREFLGRGTALAGWSALGLGTTLGTAGQARAAGTTSLPEAADVLPSYIADVTGTGTPGASDKTTVRKLIGTRRGLDVVGRAGYDYRGDVFGRGRVSRDDVKSVQQTIKYLKANPTAMRPRPVTIGWHYSWYGQANRKPKQQHVWFKGGGYSSRDPRTEETFNDLKNEFGITVDAISWADPKADKNLNEHFELGYMQATNGRTRHAALLYESLISLRATPGERIDFSRKRTRNRLIDHFRAMAKTFVQLRDDSLARVFTVDCRPVIFLYASHTWGVNVDGTGEQYQRLDETMENAINAFTAVYGTAPFIIGEEMTFAEGDRFDDGRRRRSANFDGVFIYHHAATPDFIVRGGQNVRGAYVDQVREVLTHSYVAMTHKSRFTDKPMLVVPSFAAGFSKVNIPTLHSNRVDYADFLKGMIRFHEQEYLVPAFGEQALAERPSIFSVGAWNEEWEGHAVMPSQFNRTLSPRTQKGFDYVMAIKQAYGWNHYADRQLNVGA